MLGASEKLEASEGKNKGRGAGEGTEGEPVKTFFNGPVLVYQLLVYLPIGQF